MMYVVFASRIVLLCYTKEAKGSSLSQNCGGTSQNRENLD